MRRIDRVSNQLNELSRKQCILYRDEIVGITSQDISDILTLDRANVSKDLNRLVSNGEAIKIQGRPVLFLSRAVIESELSYQNSQAVFENLKDFRKRLTNKNVDKIQSNDFNSLVGVDGSLREAIKKSKAAILYPKNGLTTLITGETGVGKSLFAENMYQYAKSQRVIRDDAPFIVFNCADFADNQQLLLSHLFGYKKGSFTGADEDKQGLVDEAQGGYLFLDEVHRLSSKGQEMLFYLMDKGTYNKLGDIGHVKQSNLRLIMATTEEPSEVMLNTFLRRIPVHIHLPSLYQKDWKEKLEFIYFFIEEECRRIDKPVRLTQEVLFLLLNYNFEGNIGQMKSEIQYTCAHAFIDSLTNQSSEVLIQLQHLPLEIVNSIGGMEDKRKDYYSLPESTLFQPNIGNNISSIELNTTEIYNQVKEKIYNYSDKGESRDLVSNAISMYADKVIQKVNKENTVMETVIDMDMFHIVSRIIRDYVADEDQNLYANIIAYHLTIVLKTTQLKMDIANSLDMSKSLFGDTGSVAIAITEKIVNQLRKNTYPMLTKFDRKILEYLIYHLISQKISPRIGILVIMHGDKTATSMANTVNELLGIRSIRSINMKLDEKVTDIYKEAKKIVQELEQGLGVLIMADMGSIKSFEGQLSKELSNEVRVMDLVSTPIILEAAKQSLSDEITLNQLVHSLMGIMIRHLQMNQGEKVYSADLRYFETVIVQRLEQILLFLDAKKTFDLFKKVLSDLEDKFEIMTSDEFLLKFIFHNGCMMEKILVEDRSHIKDAELSNNEEFFLQVEESYKIVEEYFGLSLPKVEIFNIVDMLIYEYPEELYYNNPL